MAGAFAKDTLRSMRRSLGRFLAIAAIVALGTGFYAGLRMTCPDMNLAADRYYDGTALMDVRVVSTLGLSEDDLAALRGVEGVEAVMGAWETDVMASIGDEQYAVRMHSLPDAAATSEAAADGSAVASDDPDYLNRLVLVEGRWPAAPDECVISRDRVMGAPTHLGDVVTVTEGAQDLDDALAERSFTIVGYARTPYYVSSTSMGATTLGSGSVQQFMYVPRAAFAAEAPLTEAFLTVKGAADERAGSDAYQARVDEVMARVEALAPAREEARRAALVAEADAELDDARADFEAERADAEAQLASARAQLDEAAGRITEGEREVAQGQADYDAGAAELARQRAAAARQMDDAQAQLDASAAELEAGRAPAEKAEADLPALERQWQEGADELAAAEQQWQAGSDAAEAARAQAQQGIDQAQAALASIDAGLAEARARQQALPGQLAALREALSAAPDEEAAAALRAQIASLEQAQAALPGAIAQLEAQRAQAAAGLEQARAGLAQAEQALAQLDQVRVEQIEPARAQVEEGRAGLEQARAAVAAFHAGEQQLADGRAQLAQGRASLVQGRADYEQGLAEWEDARAEADRQFADAEQQLADAQQAIDDIPEAEWLVMDRTKSHGVVSFDADAARVDSIASVFPFIFFLVAALVALTTMTRMVEEERVLIGTYKALGYSRARITSKYLVYAGAASAAGAAAGIAVLSQVLPAVIMEAYSIIYFVPRGPLPVDWPLALLAAGLGVGVTLGATWAAAAATLREQPASLMLPRAPKAGKRILLERVRPLWRRLSFSWKVTFRNLFRYKKRLVMTVIGIAGCTGLLLTGLGLQNSINDIIDKQYGALVRYNAVITVNEDADEEALGAVAALMDSPAVAFEEAALASGPDASDVMVTLEVPADPDAFQRLWVMRTREGHEPISLGQDGVVLTEKLATTLGVGPGDTVTLAGQDVLGNATSDTHELTVTGVMENYVYNYVIAGPAAYEAAYGAAPKYRSAFGDVGVGAAAHDAFNEAARATGAVKTIAYNDETIESYRTMLRSVNLVVVVLVVAAAALAFIVLYNLTNINITERAREIATLKVLGFTAHEVDLYIYREIVLLSVIGAAAGLVLGLFLEGFVVATAEVDQVMFGRDIHALSFAVAFLLTMVFTFLVMLVMRRKLSAVNMVESLKSNE